MSITIPRTPLSRPLPASKILAPPFCGDAETYREQALRGAPGIETRWFHP
jgi:hypothetical protein